MGATVTTFCNETNLVLYTSLSIMVPYYWTEQLKPGDCVDYSVGRVWFTATAQIWLDTHEGFMYFPLSTSEAVGLRYGIPFSRNDFLTYIWIFPEDAQKVMKNAKDVVKDNYLAVSHKYRVNGINLLVQEFGFYTNVNKKITITGGPKGAIYIKHPFIKGKYAVLMSANFERLKMTVTT